MPIAEFRLPDGRIAKFRVPEGTTPEQAQRMIEPLIPGLPPPKQEPGILSQVAGLPKEVAKGFIRGLTVDPISGIASLGYTGARAAGAELAPFEKTEFGQALGRAQTALAPSDAGMITQFGGGVGSLLSFLPSAGIKGGLGLLTRLTQAGAVGSEEARSRAEQAVLEGKTVSPTQQFQSQLMGGGIGFSELLSIEKLADPIKAVLRGIPASEADKIAPGLFNSAKRMLTTGGIEGFQEGMANIAQDLVQKGVYDPSLDIGKSALGDAAMGASVGAFAQGAIDFLTRGRRGQMYQQLKAEERQKEFNDKMTALEQANQKQIADTQQKLGVPDPTILALPAPAPKIEAVPERDPLMNPVGFFNANELSPEDLKVINKNRKGEGKRTLSQFSIEDLADSGAPQAEIDRLLTYKTGYDGSVQLGAENVLNAAAERNVDTSTIGFRDFLRRSTGSEDLSTMSQPQLHSAFTALSALEPSQEVQVLPPGTNATRFSDDQYTKSIDKLNTAFPEDNVMPRDKALNTIKRSSGLKSDQDAESLLQSAIRSGDLNTVSRTVFELGIPGDPNSPAARVYTNRESAERSARKLGLEVRERVHQDITRPSEFKALPGGPDIRQGTFKQGIEPEGYEIRSPDGKTWMTANQDEADAKVDRLQTLRTQMANGFLGEAAKIEKRIADNQRKLDKMEAEGNDNTLEYKKLSADVAAQNKQLSSRADGLKAKAKVFSSPLEIAPKGEKPVTREGFTLFEQGQPVAIFPTQQAAEEAALIRLPDETLQTIVNLAPTQKGLMPKRLGKMAEVELQRRRGEQPAGFGIEFKGDRAAAEARLAEAGVFTPEFQKAADELTKKLRPMMERLGLGNLRLNILKAIKTANGQTADGYYAQRLIAIALDADNPIRTLRHEGIHALKELGAFTPQQWKVLEDKAKSEWMGKYDIANRYQGMGLSQNELLEEAISDAFSDFDQTKAPPGLIGALFNKIRRFFEAFGNGLRGMGFQTAEGVFEAAEAGELRIDPNLLNYEPLGIRGEVSDESGRRYALLQHASRADFEKLDESKLGAFAFGYGAYSSITPGLGKKQISPRDLTETSKTYGSPYSRRGKGFLYLADMPLSKKNTLILDEPIKAQPEMLQKFIDAGIVERVPLNVSSSGLRVSPAYGGAAIYDTSRPSDILYSMERQYAEEMMMSGYPLTGLRGEAKPTALSFGFNDEFGIKERVAKELDNMGIEVSVLSSGTDPYAIVHRPDKFNQNIVGKYEISADGKISPVSGRGLTSPTILDRIKDAMSSFKKKESDFRIREKDLPDGVKYQLSRGKKTESTQKFEETADITPLTIQNARIYENELEGLIKKIGSRIAGMKSEETLDDVRKAVKKLQSYTAKGLKGREWYEKSAKAVLDAFNGDPVLAEKFFQIIAITSANTEVAANFTKTMNAWQQFADGRPIKVGTENENRKIDALLNFGEDWEGRKTNTFYTNLMEAMEGKDSGRSTIDLHMTRMLFDKDAPTDAQYELAENMVRLLASKVGIPARQVQAASWVTQKAKSIFDDYRAKGWKKDLDDTQLREFAFERAVADYSHLMKAKVKTLRVTDAMRELSSSIRARVQNITGEVIPSVKTEMSQLEEMDFKEKEALTKSIAKQNLVQQIAQDLGITSKIRVTVGSGAYESKVNPNLIVQLVNDDPAVSQQESLELAKAMSYVFKQDATPVFRADPALAETDQLGFRLKFDTKALTPSQQKKILAVLQNKIGSDIGFTRIRGNEIVIINFRGEDGQPFLTTDEAFQDGLADAIGEINQIAKVDAQEVFGAQSEYPYHDWEADTVGTRLIEGLYAGRPQRPDLQRRLDNIRDFFTGEARKSVEKSGATPRFSLRPDELAGRSGIGSGISIREQQPDAQSFDGVHYGKRRVESLIGSMYGTGIKGEEARRVFASPDQRIKNRAYFYIPREDGRMPMPEAGLGNEVHIQRLNNILGPGAKLQSLVDATRSPTGEVDANALESAIIDAGYDGYAAPRMGMMVVLDADVPVIPRGNRQEVAAKEEKDTVQIGDRRYALRQTDTPEFKQWFGKSEIVVKLYKGMLSGMDVMKSIGIPESKQNDYWRNLSQEERDKLMSDFRSRDVGKPKVMYHGTARDITEFRPKQANAIFLTEDSTFAEGFSEMSEDYMVRELANQLNEDPQAKRDLLIPLIDQAIADGDLGTPENSRGLIKTTRDEHIKNILELPLYRALNAVGIADALRDVIKSRLPSMRNIMPVYVRAENPFDFKNPDHIQQLRDQLNLEQDALDDLIYEVENGSWSTIESDDVQDAIRFIGFDGFYVREGGRINLAVYEPSQIKSAIGNIGTFSRDNNDIRYALALQGLKPDSALVPNEGGNKDGNLGISPERIGGKPIRMLIGTHNDITNKGYGANHILNRVLSDPNRAPGGAEELLEKIVRTAQRTAQNYNSIYRDGGKFVLYDGKNSLIVSPDKGAMSIVTMFVQDNPQKRYGAPVWVGRPSRMAEFLEPVRGTEVVEREGRVSRKEVPVQTKRVYTPAEIALAEEAPVETPRKEGTLSLKKDAFRFSLRDSLGQDTVDAIERTTTKREEKGYFQRMGEALSPTGFAKFRQAMINKYEAIERLSGDVAKTFGSNELMADQSAIAAALLSDRAAGVAASSYLNGVPVYKDGFTTVSDMDGAVKGLIPILEPLMKYNDPFVFQAFQYYAATRRGKRLDAEGREKLFTPQDIKRGELLGNQYPEFKQVFDEYQKYNKGLVDFMKDTGVISEKEAEIWTQNWDYIPFYRQLENEEIAAPNIFSPIAGVSKPKKLKGGEAPLADFMETIVRNSRAAIESGMRNVAAQRVMRDMLRLNQGELVPAALARGSDIVTVKENGLTKHYRVDDPLLVEALKSLNLPQLPFLEVLAAPSTLLRNLVTKDPGFMLANLMRDSLQAWVTTGTNIIPIVDTFKQYGAALTGMSKEAKALANAGLFAGYDFGSDVKSSARGVEAELRKRAGQRSAGEIAMLPLSKMWDLLDKGSSASDVATRAEVYKRTLKETGNEAEALYQAMEVLNFSRKGNSALIRVLTALVPFMNARIQGLDVLYRSGFGKSATQNRERMQKAFITRSLSILALSAMYWMLASDTEEYKNAEQEVRDNYWIIGNVRIPIPFEIGTVFKVFPERILEYFFGDDTSKDLKSSIVRNITSTLAFNPIPQAFLPVVENVANYSFFTGQPVVGKGLEDVAAKYQASPGTSLLAQEVGTATGYSPIKIDNLIRGYTGTLGTYGVMLLDSIMRGEGDPPKAALRVEQFPVIKRFFASPEATGSITAYYELKKAVDESTRTINFLERTGDMKDLQEYMQDKGSKLQAIKPYIQALDKDMTMLREMRRTIQVSQMDSEQKADVLENIRRAEIALTSRIQFVKKSID